ncbi:MAG: glycerophosphodiester phosphodiesterase [Propioniciclava sp.]|uniref:glycerophosphodiester phosphodiesterase n=1 Tax=Propioniciclava sp. TaxID=2038686 RepID=UPI0039E3F0A2
MTKVWAHRGASADAPENTLPAFELALEQGADGFELDVQLTRDDEVVVIHDETLERCTDGHGWVADHSLDDLRKLDASAGRDGFGGTRIPTLGDVFGLVQGTEAVINVELKNSKMAYKGLEERVLAVIAEYEMTHRVVLSSFNHDSLRYLRSLTGGVRLGALYDQPLWKPWAYARRLGVHALHPSLSSARRRVVRHAHDEGLDVNVWTVNEASDIMRMVEINADAVVTNHPALAREVIG